MLSPGSPVNYSAAGQRGAGTHSLLRQGAEAARGPWRCSNTCKVCRTKHARHAYPAGTSDRHTTGVAQARPPVSGRDTDLEQIKHRILQQKDPTAADDQGRGQEPRVARPLGRSPLRATTLRPVPAPASRWQGQRPSYQTGRPESMHTTLSNGTVAQSRLSICPAASSRTKRSPDTRGTTLNAPRPPYIVCTRTKAHAAGQTHGQAVTQEKRTQWGAAVQRQAPLWRTDAWDACRGTLWQGGIMSPPHPGWVGVVHEPAMPAAAMTGPEKKTSGTGIAAPESQGKATRNGDESRHRASSAAMMSSAAEAVVGTRRPPPSPSQNLVSSWGGLV